MKIFSNILTGLPELELDESKKKILILYILGILIIIAAYLFIFVQPSLARLFSLIPKIGERSAEIRELKNDLNFRETLDKRMKMLKGSLGSYEKRLSPEKELPALVSNISKLARESKVKILSITPLVRIKKEEEPESESVYQEVPIAISAQSGYHELGEFVNKLETGERFMQISDIKIKSNRANAKKHDTEFIVYAYTFKSEK